MHTNLIKLNNINTSSRVSFGNAVSAPKTQSYAQNPISSATYGALQHNATIQTQLNSKADIQKFSLIAANLDQEGRQAANLLLKTGILLNNNSNDKSSTLDNLHNIITNPRAKGLDMQKESNVTTPFVLLPASKYKNPSKTLSKILELFDNLLIFELTLPCCLYAFARLL